MRRILITPSIVGMAKEYAQNLFKNRNSDFEQPLERLNNLERQLRAQNANKHADYVKMIIQKYSVINSIQPKYYKQFHEKYFETLNKTELSNKFEYKGEMLSFHKIIVKVMRYEDAREKEFLPYVKKLGIKTCVYCNTQFAITVGTEDEGYSGKYELDHFKPKSEFPYLCTSFYNLQPCCSSCNKSKFKSVSSFGLYTGDQTLLNPFIFRLRPESIVKYLNSFDCEELEIGFDCDDEKLKVNHENLFHISELYKTQKDVAEEVIWKYKVYNPSYRKSLCDSLGPKFSSKMDFNRFILGNYCKDSEVHKRPMAKLVQDIAKQLGII